MSSNNKRPDSNHNANDNRSSDNITKQKEDALSIFDNKNQDLITKKSDIEPPQQEVEEDSKNVIMLKPPIIVKDLAEQMSLKPFAIIKDLMNLSVFASINQSIEPEVAEKLCIAHGFEFNREKREKGGGFHKKEEKIEEPKKDEPEKETVQNVLATRAPIITFMGHVDHGKTSLLDYIRKTRIASGEAGGITQHIGAYSINKNGNQITFLDTPGHAAFTEMRARGANVTDIVVIVVAANDGIMPQTIEAINHAKAANVSIIVAINKIDLPSANLDRVKTQLQEQGVAPEEWGGDTPCVEVSAIKGTGVDDLLDLLLLQAEIMELRADHKANARATIIEAQVEVGKGHTATAIVETGTLKVGMSFICGSSHGKIKSLVNDIGERIKQALPATPVEIVGFNGLVNVGDELVQMENEFQAKKLGQDRQHNARSSKLVQTKKVTLEGLFASIENNEKQSLNVILKGDTQGSIEAIVNSLKNINSDKVLLNILHSGVGLITEGDILLASASNAIVLGFNSQVESKAVKTAKNDNIQIKLYSIIYELLDQVKEAMQGLLSPEERKTIVGHAKVKQSFRIKRGRVAGCIVSDGLINRNMRACITRGGTPVYDGPIGTLKRFQDEVEEVKNGLECGIRLGNFNNYIEGDVIECYRLEKIEQTL